ncbi:sulfatase-like hydrolase/transferase [Lentisphaera araneosa]|uniref:sulfatase-like hydrolase/transferase n=1 Tax=Lentisphaera araneosa TaxID=256847 RepID=UPI00236869A8|nr:sulfatase-like hydrolase/transferase [Lentisphaera araneosa]
MAVDDLNDWIGVLGGYPHEKTPNIDRLANRGMLFTNAHCQSPVCGPSRESMMSSLDPSNTGIYFLGPGLKESPRTKNHLVMPSRFEDEGYQLSTAGKLYCGLR